MKEFNLEEAKAGKPVCTRNGLSAKIIDWGEEDDDDDYPIIAEIVDGELEAKNYYTNEGRFYNSRNSHSWDLMMEE